MKGGWGEGGGLDKRERAHRLSVNISQCRNGLPSVLTLATATGGMESKNVRTTEGGQVALMSAHGGVDGVRVTRKLLGWNVSG
jgi:hypothetical protein